MSRRLALPVLAGAVLALTSSAGLARGHVTTRSTARPAIPAAAQPVVSRALGRSDPRFAARRTTAGYSLGNKAGLLARFTTRTATVRTGGAAWQLGLRAFGRGSRLARVGSSALAAHANRVSYRHGGVDEWYAAGPLGLEQGFTLISRPTGTAPLTLALGKLPAGLHARLSPDRRSMSLSRGHFVVLRYRDLVAHDARGRSLSARIVVSGRRPSLRIDDRGAVYPLRIDPYVETAELTASDGSAGAWFGFSVAISGDTIAVGSQRVDSGQGAVYVFVKPGGGWGTATETAKLTASDGAANDNLGSSVAIDGDTIVAGAPEKPYPSQDGAAYVFVKPGGGWGSVPSQHQAAKLTASDGAGTHEYFGYSVAISGDTIAVGAYNDTVNANQGAGAVYVFVEPVSGWADATQTAKLTASDGTTGAHLGGISVNGGVAIDGDTIVAGAGGAKVGAVTFQGAVYVFVKPGGGWVDGTETAKLTASDGATFHGLGTSAVAISGNTIAAGGGSSTGAVYVFVEPGGGWAAGTETAKLTASDGQSGDALGWSVAISGDTIVSGARENANLAGTGAAYVFDEPAGGWGTGTGHEDQKLTSSDPLSNLQNGFGYSVGIDSGTILVGSPFTDLNPMVGQEGLTDVFESGGGGGGTFTLSVSKAGSGAGTVTSSPAGISCGSTCSHPFASGATVHLTATTAAGSSFAGWSGACSGSGTCTTQMTQARSVVATFTSSGRPIASFTMPNLIRPGAVTTLNAGTSLNAKAYNWDLNGDGHTDVSCSTSQLQTQFMPPPGARNTAGSLAQVRLTVVSATGATSTITDASPFIGGAPISQQTSNFFNQNLSAYCIDFRKAGICVTPATLAFSVIEATGCDLHQVTGTADVPDLQALVQSTLNEYENSSAYVTYVKALCDIAVHVGDLSSCAVVSRLNHRDISPLLDTNSILLWESHGPVTIDGLDFRPAPGTAIVVSPLLQTIFWSDAEVDLNGYALGLPKSDSFSFKDVNVPLTLNATDDHIAHVIGFDPPLGSGVLPGLFGLTPQHVDLSFVRSVSDERYTQIATTLSLPEAGQAVLKMLDGSPVTVTGTFRETNDPSGGGLLQLANVHGMADHIGFGDLIPVQLDNVNIDYAGLAPHTPLSITGAIQLGDASISLAPDQYYPDNGIVFWDGGLHSAGATLHIPCPDLCLHLFPGVDLDELHLGFAYDPTVVTGGGELQVIDLVHVHGGIAFAFPSSRVQWTLDQKSLPELPGDWTPRTFGATTVALAGKAGMDVPILKDLGDLANAYFVYSFPSYIAFGGGVDWNLFDIVTFTGGLSGEMNVATKRFNFEGHLQTCVVDVLCGGAFGVVSSAGAGACFVVGPVSVGGGVQYARITEPFIWPVDGCKWSRFTEDNIFDNPVARAAGPAQRPYVVTIKQGDPSRVVQLDGSLAAPAVEVTGPGGIDVTSSQGDCTPASPTVYNGSTCLTVDGKVRIMRSPRSKEAVVGLQDPVPGTYTITPLPGSPEFSHVFNASDVANLAISGQVSGIGFSRTLAYNMPRIPGEQVTFLDVAPNGAAQTIGTVVGGGSGSLQFTPAEGTVAHTVTAEVELAGIPVPMLSSGSGPTRQAAAPSARLRITTFMPPKPVRPGAAKRVQATHKGTSVTVRWGKAAHATSYKLVVVLANKTSWTLSAKHTSVKIRNVPRTEAGRVSVLPVGRDGGLGPARKASFRATAKAPTLIAPFPAKRCTVPKVVGMTEPQANKTLLLAGCAEGKVTKSYSSKAPKGRVLSQSSAPGAKRRLGTKVGLVLSKGRKR